MIKVFVVLVVLLLSIYIVSLNTSPSSMESFTEAEEAPPPIYGILVTGKSECRNLFSQTSVDNFIAQDYSNKHLLIINHGDKPVLQRPTDGVVEHMIQKNKKTLGDLRNMALDMVPAGAYWTTWDDDDYRTTNYLSWLYSFVQTEGADLVAFTHRYEYNYKTDFFWETTLLRGFVTCLAKKEKRIRYKSLNAMEDVDILTDYRKAGKKVFIILDNDPSVYVRLVHGDNTSVWVNPLKKVVATNTGAFWGEKNVPDDIKKEQSKFIFEYYNKGLACMQNS